MHKYFISYVVTLNNNHRYCNTCITLENEITMDDILNFEENMIKELSSIEYSCKVNVLTYKQID